MTRRIGIMLLALLLAAPAGAGDWTVGCNSSRVATGFSGGLNVLCYDPSSASDDSPILPTGACENTDWHLFDDKNGDGTVCTVAWDVEECPDPKGSLSAAAEDNACEIANGTESLSGDDVESNLAGIYMRLKGDGIGANATDCRILVKCALRSQ